MGITDRIKAVFSRKPYLESSIRVWEGSGMHGEKPWPFDYYHATVNLRGWIYRCLQGNAEAAASVPLRMYVRKRSAARMRGLARDMGYVPYPSRPVSRSRKDYLLRDRGGHGPSERVTRKLMEFGTEFEEIAAHPAIDVLREVNPVINGFDLSVFRFLSQEVTGNAYVHPVMSAELDRPVELWPMLPWWTHIVPGERTGDDLIAGYTYGNPAMGFSDCTRFERDEVLHFRSTSLESLYYGMGKVEACWQQVGINRSHQVMQKAIFDNNGRPDFVVTLEGADEDVVQRTDKKIAAITKGVRNAGKWLTLSNRATVTPLTFPPKELGADLEVLEEIAAVCGYPITKLKANDPNRANAETGDATWMRDTILPMIRRDEEALNQNGYLGLFGGGALEDEAVLAYDDPVPSNRKLELAEARTRVTMGAETLNEYRQQIGRDEYPAELGDIPRINGQRVDLLDEEAEARASVTGFPEPAPATADAGQGAQSLSDALAIALGKHATPQPDPFAGVDIKGAIRDAMGEWQKEWEQVQQTRVKHVAQGDKGVASDTAEDHATPPASAQAMVAVARQRAALSGKSTRQPAINISPAIHVPEQKMEPPVINVKASDVNAPAINVSPTPVNINNHIEAKPGKLDVTVSPRDRRVDFKVDDMGMITGAEVTNG